MSNLSVEFEHLLDSISMWIAPAPGQSGTVAVSDDARSLATDAARSFGDTVAPCSGFSRRWSTFVGDTTVVRVVHPDISRSEVGTMFASATRVSELPQGPVLLATEPGKGVLVERRQSGVSLYRCWPELSVAARQRSAADLCEFRYRLAAVPVSERERSVAQVQLRDRIAAEFEVRTREWALAALAGPLAWRHGDLHADNVLVDPESGKLLAVIDWEWASITVEPVDQIRLHSIAAYQVGRPWVRSCAGQSNDSSLLAALALQFAAEPLGEFQRDRRNTIRELVSRFAELRVLPDAS